MDSGGQFGYTLADDSIDANVLADGQASYQYGAGLVSEVRGGVSKAYHADALGTTRAMSGANGTVTDALETDAFGNTVSSVGTSPSPFGFAGQHGYQTDSDSGLMRLGYRFYDASVGRFISRDPAMAGYNWYTYCDNDPVNGVDPEGLEDRTKTAPGQVINMSKHKTVRVVADKGGEVVTIDLPPGYQTNPGEIDIDYVGGKGSYPRWKHIGGCDSGVNLPLPPVIDIPVLGDPITIIPTKPIRLTLGPSIITDGPISWVPGIPSFNDDPNYPNTPPNMGTGSPGRKLHNATLAEALKEGWVTRTR